MYMRFCACDTGQCYSKRQKIGKDIDVPENLGAIIEIPGLAQAIMANHSAEDIDVLCDTVCEMDLGVLTRVK